MNSFLAILGESIRLLRARKLFWISLGISALVALMYLSIGFDENGPTFFFGAWHLKMESAAQGTQGAEMFYTGLFTSYIVGGWMTWASMILALISCAPIFPEFMLEGAAGVTLSKPVSRVALFLYKFVGGLLFVTLQTTLFAAIVVIAIRWRIGVWMPSVFMAIPVVTLVFSYLFSIQTLIGVKTRSVMFSILGTILMWLTFYFLNLGQAVTYQLGEIGRNPVNMEKLSPDEQATWRRVNGWIEETRAALPKTAETANLMNRVIVLQNGNNLLKEQEQMDGAVGNQAKYEGRHSPAYIVWTSLASELVILGFAAWIFSRRDF